MKQTPLRGVLAVIVLFLCIAASVQGDTRKNGFSSTTEVSIDGRSFFADGSFSSDSTLLRRELSKLGVRPPESLEIPWESGSRNPIFSENLVETAKPRSIGVPKTLQGMRADHALRMAGAGHSVEIITGRLESSGASVASRLSGEGWAAVSMEEGNHRLSKLFQKIRGKEAAVVCLDEKEGAFLLLRKLER